MKLTPTQSARLGRDLIAILRKHGVTRASCDYDIVGERSESLLRVRYAETGTPPLPDRRDVPLGWSQSLSGTTDSAAQCDGHCDHVKLDASPYGVYPKP